jgi:hypothetical protein
MTVARFAVSFDQALAREIRRAAGKEPISTWLADAAGRKLRAEGLLAIVSEWEAEFGAIEDSTTRLARKKASTPNDRTAGSTSRKKSKRTTR